MAQHSQDALFATANHNRSLPDSDDSAASRRGLPSGDHHRGGVSELADEHDLGSCAARRGGSSPPFPIPTQFTRIKQPLVQCPQHVK